MGESRLTTDQQRTALYALGRDGLRELTEHFDLDVVDRRVTDHHVDALADAFADVLGVLKRAELKLMCEALGLDTGGREKQLYIDRILSLGDGTVRTPPPAKIPGSPA